VAAVAAGFPGIGQPSGPFLPSPWSRLPPLAPVASLADALAVNAARPLIAGKPFEYGWIRGAASAALPSGTLLAGQLVSSADLDPIIWMNVALLAVCGRFNGAMFRANLRAARDRAR